MVGRVPLAHAIGVRVPVPQQKNTKMDFWKHGKYVDMWSVVHFLSGYNLFLFFNLWGLDLVYSLIFSVILLLLWEVFEWSVKIIEASPNVIMDIVIGFLGFVFGWFIHNILNLESSILYFIIILSMTIVLSISGFLKFLKKK